MASALIANELEKWDERVIWSVQFNKESEKTKKYLKTLDKYLFESLTSFVAIYANSEPLVYKICRYFIEKDMKNDDFTMIDGEIIKAYTSDKNQQFWKIQQGIDDILSIYEISNKVVFIPIMNFSMDAASSIYLYTQMKKKGVRCLVFYSDFKGEGFGETLIKTMERIDHFYQFPEAKVKRSRKRALVDDEW